MRKPNRNHEAYSSVLLKHLSAKTDLTWTEAAELLVEEFSWTFKTASNRIHELVALGILEVTGEYRKGTFGRAEQPDNRVIKLP